MNKPAEQQQLQWMIKISHQYDTEYVTYAMSYQLLVFPTPTKRILWSESDDSFFCTAVLGYDRIDQYG